MRLKKNKIIPGLIILIMLSSCKPVNFLTRLKRTPRNYSLNYCGEDIRAPKTEFNKETWIVFSDRNNNPAYRNPGGKVKMKTFGFMDAFFVIKKKGEYYKLIKYDPAIVENPYSRKIKDRKKAEYCGWIHQSKLLLTKQSITDISTGFKDKQISIITDSTCLSEPNAFFIVDSINTFTDENLSAINGTIPHYSILYTLKTSLDQKKTLVSRKTIISPDSAKFDVLGWIPSTLIRSMGQRLHVDLNSIPKDSLVFKNKILNDTLSVSSWVFDESKNFSRKTPPFKHSPVSFYCRENENSIRLKTGIPISIIDNSDNYVFNVNGNKISYGKFKELEKDLRKMNILFVLEGREKVIQSYAEITNIIQNLQPLFENEEDIYSYKFGVVLATQGYTKDDLPSIKTTGIINNYTQMMDFLINETDTNHHYAPMPTQYAWSGVKKAVDLLEPYQNETNLLIVIGETGYSEWADSVLVKRMANSNCRILGFQMHGIEANIGNNFVLQIENMIENCAKRESIIKREKLVYADQIKPRNLFREISKNVYALDFPDRSMSQGWVLFPEKGIDLPLNILANSIDTFICEVMWDNDNIVSSLYNAFNSVGNHRYKYDTLFTKYAILDTHNILHKELPRKFTEQLPMSYLPSQQISIADSINKNSKYHLLLSESELDEIMQYLEKLSAIEVDYKYKGRKKRRQKKCNCPDDDLIVEEIILTNDSTGTPEYRSTWNLRRKLKQTFIKDLRTCRLCKRSRKEILGYTLNEAHRHITECPTYTPILEQYQIKDIRKKKRLSDAELDKLIEHFKQKKEDLVRHLSVINKFESNKQTYYWVDQNMLP